MTKDTQLIYRPIGILREKWGQIKMRFSGISEELWPNRENSAILPIHPLIYSSSTVIASAAHSASQVWQP